MESKLAIKKGGQVAISIRDDHEQEKPASPQLFWYYMFLCLVSFFFSVPAAIFHSKLLLAFKQHPGGVFVIMTFVTITVTILASTILVFTSYLRSYMRTIHYTVLKAIGSLSGILAPFFFGVALFVPDNPSKTVYTLIGVISFGIVVGCCFYWKYAISHQQHTDFNELSSPWMLFIPVFLPLEVVCWPLIPDNLHWIVGVCFFVQISILCVAFIKMIARRQI